MLGLLTSLSVELHQARREFLVSYAGAGELRLRKSRVKATLVRAHFLLRLLKALTESHLTLSKDVLSARCISLLSR